MKRTSEDFQYHEINFGPVVASETATRKIAFKNPTTKAVQYLITRNPKTNPIYHVFDVNQYNVVVQPDQITYLTVTYKPRVPWAKDNDYFHVVDGHSNVQKVCVQGESVGAVVNTSTKYLNFDKLVQQSSVRKTFELQNLSDVPATFQFDVDEANLGTFRVEPLRDVIQPRKLTYVTVTFCPKSTGLFSGQLACLVLYHEPLIVNLFGISLSNESQKFGEVLAQPDVKRFSVPHEETVSFLGFLKDSIVYTKTVPPVSLTNIYLDFGSVLSQNRCQSLTTSLTNHTDSKIEIVWEKDDTFRMNPSSIVIPSKASVLFECKFVPKTNCLVYSKILNGDVIWNHDERFLAVPIPINLRLIGNAFPPNQYWMPELTVCPQTVIMPLSVPNIPSRTTFLLRCTGTLPVLFKLLPPKKSNYVIKPMVGLVRTYQILVVQLHDNSTLPNSYIETWNVELNGQVDRLMPVYLKGQTDLPRIDVGISNTVDFGEIQPGSQSHVYVPLRNWSMCQTSYTIVNNCDQLEITEAKGVLNPNDEIYSCWTFTATREGAEAFTVKIHLQAILNGFVLIGEQLEQTVSVTAHCSYSELCAIPRSCNMGQIERGWQFQTGFYLFNFGRSVVYFELFAQHSKTKEPMQDIVFTPKTGKCGPKEKVFVTAGINCRGSQLQQIVFFYQTLVSEYCKTISSDKRIEVFNLQYFGEDPAVQIEEIIDHNFGHVFTKMDLWDILNVDRFNEVLRGIQKGQTEHFDMSVPDSELNSSKMYYVTFLVKNTTNLNIPVALKRRKICDCQFKEVVKGLSCRTKVLECPHKQVARLEIPEPTISANSLQMLILTVKYCLPDQTCLNYLLHIGNDRTVDIKISVTSTTADNPILSAYNLNMTLDFRKVYIGLKQPSLRAFRIYNNASYAVPFLLNDLGLLKACNSEGFEVLKCLNTRAHVEPYSSFAILFRFWPIEAKHYKISVPLSLGTRNTELTIKGYGTSSQHKNEDIVNTKLSNQTSASNFIASELFVSLSADHLVIGSFLVHSSAERLIFFTNKSRSSTFQFAWKPCFVDGLVKITTNEPQGVLEPEETRPVIIHVKSLSEPVNIRMSLFCQCLDLTQLMLHQKSIAEYEQRQQQIQEYGISEDSLDQSVVLPENEVKIVAPPEPFTLSLSLDLNVVSSMDKDRFLPVKYQFKQPPYHRVTVDVKQVVNDHFGHDVQEKLPNRASSHPESSSYHHHQPDVEELRGILDCLTSDAVFGSYFEEIFTDLKRQPNPLYSQVRLQTEEILKQADVSKECIQVAGEQMKKKEALMSLSTPQLTEASDIFKKAAYESIEKTFQL